MKNNKSIKRQLQALREENNYLHNDIEVLQGINTSVINSKAKKEKENMNLEELAKLGTSLNIIMTQMLDQCDEDTLVGSAYKSAILQYQRTLAEGMGMTPNRNNVTQTDELWN